MHSFIAVLSFLILVALVAWGVVAVVGLAFFANNWPILALFGACWGFVSAGRAVFAAPR